MSQDAINAQNRRVARVGRRFVAGNVALDRLVTRLGGIGIGTVPGALPLASPAAFVNAASCDAPIGGGSGAGLYGSRTDPYKYGVSMGGSAIVAAPVAGTGASGQTITDDVADAAAIAAACSNGSAVLPGTNGNGAPAAPGSAAAPTVGAPTAGSPGNPWPGPNWWVPSRRFLGGKQCRVPQIVPLQTVFPANPNPTPIVIPGAPPAPAGPAAPSVPPVAGAPVAAPTFPTTGNVCLDAALGYVIPSQLDPSQQFICAMAGYGALGERPGPLLTQAMAAWRNANPSLLPKVPLQSNPPAASMSMLPTAASSVLGVAGLDRAPSWQGLAIVVTLGAALGFLYARFGQKGRF